MMMDAGYPIWLAILSSLFIYAGSMQIIMVSLLTAGANLWTVAIMTFFINARHIFYGLGFIGRFRQMGWRYPYMVLTLTDETYSVLCSVVYPENLDQKQADFFIAMLNHAYWVLGTVLGALIGNYLAFDLSGIDFSATAFFLVIVINQLQTFPSKIPTVIGLVSALVFYFLLGVDYFLIPALSVSLLVLVVLRDRVHLALQRKENLDV